MVQKKRGICNIQQHHVSHLLKNDIASDYFVHKGRSDQLQDTHPITEDLVIVIKF